MSALTLSDLDDHPELIEETLALFRGCPPGRQHAVLGEPCRMGLEPRQEDLDDCLGVLLALHDGRLRGCLGLCRYSDKQVTLWGPVVHRGHVREGVGARLLEEARTALRDGGYEALRVLVDQRNRVARSFFLAKGLAAWRDNHLYECRLDGPLPPSAKGVSVARPADHGEVTAVLASAFPDSGHIERPLTQREREGYRHHILQDSGRIIGAAAVRTSPRRNWLTLIAIRPEHRGKGLGHDLIRGVIAGEARLGATRLGLEVLADNAAAIAMYEAAGMTHSWTATIMTGPA